MGHARTDLPWNPAARWRVGVTGLGGVGLVEWRDVQRGICTGVFSDMSDELGGERLLFEHLHAFVGLLDRGHGPILERQSCTITWTPGPGNWMLQIEDEHAFELAGLDDEAWYVAIYSGRDADEMLFTFPLVGRPVAAGTLHVGPSWG